MWVEKYFGKPAQLVEAADIMRFFRQGHREGQHLEFKSGEVRMEKIMKVVGGFLNSSGGLLIVGAPRESDIPGMEDVRSSFGEPDPNRRFEEESLYNAIINGITPKPTGVKIKQVRFNKGSVFLIEVAASEYPPHQVFHVGNYYLRKGDTTRPARHHEVERMFFENRRPNLDLQVELARFEDAIGMNLILSNQSTVSAESPGVNLEAFPVRNNGSSKLTQQNTWNDNYLAQSQRLEFEVELLPQQTVLFFIARYFCKDVPVRFKSAFVSVEHRKAGLIEVFDSQKHGDFRLWYDQHSYLLNE